MIKLKIKQSTWCEVFKREIIYKRNFVLEVSILKDMMKIAN